MRIISVVTIVALLALSFTAFAQSPETSFTINLTPITLPGGHASVAGIESGLSLALTPNLDVKESNLAGSGFQFYGGGANYHIPAIGKFLNNKSPNINGLLFDFYLTGTVGTVLTPSSAAGGHWGERIGGGFNYSLNGTWALGAEIQYAKFPGYANNTYTVAVGPKIHF